MKKKGTKELFKLYLLYGEPEMSEEKMKHLDETTFNVLKDYFFAEIEGYTLDTTYDEFMEYVNR